MKGFSRELKTRDLLNRTPGTSASIIDNRA